LDSSLITFGFLFIYELQTSQQDTLNVTEILIKTAKSAHFSLSKDVDVYIRRWNGNAGERMKQIIFSAYMHNNRIILRQSLDVEHIEIVNFGITLLEKMEEDKSNENDRKSLEVFSLGEPFINEMLIGNRDNSKNPNDDPVFQYLKDIASNNRGSDGEYIAARIFQRVSGKMLSDIFDFKKLGIVPKSLACQLMFGNAITCGNVDDYNTNEIVLLTNGTIQFFPNKDVGPDIVSPLAWKDPSVKTNPPYFYTQVKNFDKPMIPSIFQKARQSLCPSEFFRGNSATVNRTDFFKYWTNHPTMYDLYIRCVVSITGYSSHVWTEVAKHNEAYPNQPLLLLELTENLIGFEFAQYFHRKDKRDKLSTSNLYWTFSLDDMKERMQQEQDDMEDKKKKYKEEKAIWECY